MAPSHTIFTRDDSLDQDNSLISPDMANIIISVLALLILICSGITAYFLLRRRRQSPSQGLLPTHGTPAHHRHPSISTNFDGPRHSSVYVYDEKHNLIADASSPARGGGSVPEIRITFPDEEGTSDKAKGGRVVIVNVGDSGTVGMEPLKEESLPPYSSSTDDRFQSLDLNRIGGLNDAKEAPKRLS